MWIRYAFVSFLNLCAELFLQVLLLAFIVPATLPTFAFTAIGWVVGVLITAVFTHWVFSKKVAERRDVIMLSVFHAIIFLAIYAGYGTLFSDRGALVAVSPEILAQLVLEVLIICLVAYHSRRRRLQSVLGEGRMM
jgi:hypothetical protein